MYTTQGQMVEVLISHDALLMCSYDTSFAFVYRSGLMGDRDHGSKR